QPGTPAWDARMGLTLLAIIFTNPQLNSHDLSLLILRAALGFAALYMLRAEPTTRRVSSSQPGVFSILWQACLWLLYFTPLLFLGAILDPTSPLPIRLTTWLMAAMLGLLAALSVRAIRET